MEPETIQQLRQEFVDQGGLLESDFEFLVSACGSPTDIARLRRLLRRRQLGEPREYVAGFQDFRGRRFEIDKRVYITDPELTHLVDTAVERGKALREKLGRAPVLVEFGVGCGSLAISVKKELPDARMIGLDLDGDALPVALKNASRHHADIWLLESDLFSAVPAEIEPDLIFGDPPWGDESSLYDDDRPASHYLAMPPLSAFPSGESIVAVHEALLADVAARGWDSEILLNLGILADEQVQKLAGLAATSEILRFGDNAILLCCMNQSP